MNIICSAMPAVKSSLVKASLLFGLAIAFLIGCSSDPPAPNFRVESAAHAGDYASLKSLHGKVAVLDFWATWCGPCRQLMPIVQSVYSFYKDKGVNVLGISDEPSFKVNAYRQSSETNYPDYIDDDDSAMKAFNVTSLPRLIVIDKDGDIVYDSTGFPIDVSDLREKIERSLRGD